MIRLLKNLPIKYKLFLAYAAVSLVVLALSFSLLFFHIRKYLEARILDDLNKSNQTVTTLVETMATVSIKSHLKGIAEKNRDILVHIYQDAQNGFFTEAQAKKQAESILLSQAIGETGYIYCVDGKGVVKVHPHKQVAGKDIRNRAFIQKLVNTKNGFIEYGWKNPGDSREKSKATYISYFEPWDWIICVSSYKSEFAKLVNIDDFKDKILSVTKSDTGYSCIFDMNGNMVLHPRGHGNCLNLKDENGKKLFREMITEKNGFHTYFWKNPVESGPRKKCVAFCHIRDFDWIVASTSYMDVVFAPLSKLKYIFYITMILTFLILAAVSLMVSTTIVRPLRVLIHRFKEGAQGDLTSKIEASGRDETGKLANSFNLFMDRIDAYQKEITEEISHRKETEAELNALRNFLINIIDSLPSIIIALDEDMKITRWNSQAEKATGIIRKQAYRHHITEVLPRIKAHLPVVEQSLETGKIRRVKRFLYTDEQGEERFENITISPLTGSRKHEAVVRIDDVTEALRMEETLIQNEKMLSVGGLAAGMAHEINNPLSGVIQNANLLASRLFNSSMPANIRAAKQAGIKMEAIQAYMESRSVFTSLSAIIEAGSRMAEIVTNMLSFARKAGPALSTHNPVELMDKILKIASAGYDLKKQYDFKSIIIEKEYEPDLPQILCEGTKIQQVLLNILTNGAQAMVDNPPDKPPKFILRLIHEKEARKLCIEIEDNGPGISPDVKKRIFEPFFTTKPVGVGTGLGLSVSYFIITKTHNGSMDVVSHPGRGSRFIIRLPLI